MNHRDRLLRLKTATGLTTDELAIIFGVSYWTVEAWLCGRRGMAHDSYATLLRLECDNILELAPKLRPDTVRAINEGRRRAMGER